MHCTIVVDDVPFDVWLRRSGGQVQLEVDGEPMAFTARLRGARVTLTGAQGEHHVDVPAVGTVVLDGAPARVRVARYEPGGGPGDHASPGAAGGPVRAPMAGRIVRVLKGAGDEVAQGEPVLVLEAMKMQIDVPSPARGVVERVEVAAGDAVEGSALLFTVRAAAR